MYNRDQIRGELIAKGSSLASVARELGLDYQTVYAVASGQRSRRVESHIAQKLGKQLHEIWPQHYPETRV